MNITASAIKRTRVTGVAIAALMLGGMLVYGDMPRALDPGFIMRVAQVVTFFPGASPERVELLVTDPIEEVIQEIPELDFSVSQSRVGLSVVTVMFREEFTEMRPLFDKLRRKVDRIRPELPDGLMGPIVNDEFGDVYGVIFTMTGEGFSDAELREFADQVRDELLRVDDVAKVDILGGQEERIFVEYDNARLAQLGLSPMALRSILEARNIIMPGGSIDVGTEEIVLEPTGNFLSVEELERTVIQLPGTQDVTYLGDIAEVTRSTVDPPRSLVRASDKPCLALAISMSEGGNLIALGARVRAVYGELQAGYPHGVDFDMTFFEPTNVQAKVTEFENNVVQAMLIVLVVMLLALGVKTGAVVATLIPATMIITVLLMNAVGITINQMSLTALIIALGLLVDNAIVMSESIVVRMREGEKPFDAAVASANELRVPLLTSSLTTSAAFLPMYLAESATGEYIAPLFLVVTISLLVSWGLALTMTPLLCVVVLKPKSGAKKAAGDRFGSRFYVAYRSMLVAALRRRWLSLGAVLAVFVGVMMLFGLVPKMFFPSQDRTFFLADFKLAPSTPIGETRAMAAELDAFVHEELLVTSERDRGVTDWTTFIGKSPPRFVLSFSPTVSEPYAATMMVNVTDHEVIADLMARLERHAIDRYPEVETYVRELQYGPPVTKPVQIRLSGRDTGRLFEIVNEVKDRLTTLQGARNISDDWGVRVKKFIVRIDAQRAQRAGVTNLDVALSLQTYLDGLEVTDYREDEDVIPVVMRSEGEGRADIDRLETLNVFSQSTGTSVPLRQVAEIDLAFQPSKIIRRNRSRTVTVGAELRPGVTAAEVIAELSPWLDEQQAQWGVGYHYELGGEAESSEKANASINAKLPIAGLVIILLLVWQFNSLRKSFIVLTTIPLALIGVVIGLLVMDSYFGIMTFMGVIALAGIVINNAIVLLERIQVEIDENGLSPQHAVIEAAQRRLRPILLTTATTAASLIPLYYGGGLMYQPLAISIVFGLLFATFLTLGFVPLMYSFLFRASFRDFTGSGAAAKLGGRLAGPPLERAEERGGL